MVGWGSYCLGRGVEEREWRVNVGICRRGWCFCSDCVGCFSGRCDSVCLIGNVISGGIWRIGIEEKVELRCKVSKGVPASAERHETGHG